jgi:ribosomal protein L29
MENEKMSEELKLKSELFDIKIAKYISDIDNQIKIKDLEIEILSMKLELLNKRGQK